MEFYWEEFFWKFPFRGGWFENCCFRSFWKYFFCTFSCSSEMIHEICFFWPNYNFAKLVIYLFPAQNIYPKETFRFCQENEVFSSIIHIYQYINCLFYFLNLHHFPNYKKYTIDCFLGSGHLHSRKKPYIAHRWRTQIWQKILLLRVLYLNLGNWPFLASIFIWH